MRQFQLACALALTVIATAAIVEAQGKPGSVPVGPPQTPVVKPETPPVPPQGDTLKAFVCSILPVPYLCN